MFTSELQCLTTLSEVQLNKSRFGKNMAECHIAMPIFIDDPVGYFGKQKFKRFK